MKPFFPELGCKIKKKERERERDKGRRERVNKKRGEREKSETGANPLEHASIYEANFPVLFFIIPAVTFLLFVPPLRRNRRNNAFNFLKFSSNLLDLQVKYDLRYLN